jgi:hypothetical protein
MTTLFPIDRPVSPPTWRTIDTIALLRRLSGAPRLAPGLTLWLVLLSADDIPTGVAVPVPDLPLRPDVWAAAGALEALEEHTDGGRAARLAVGYVRQQGGAEGAVEVAWSQALHRAAAERRVKIAVEVAVGRDLVTLMSSDWLQPPAR